MMLKIPMMVLMAAVSLQAQMCNILLWDHDQDALVRQSINEPWIGTEQPLYDLLTALGHRVSLTRKLPSDISSFDAVFITLGYLAPS